MNTHQNHWSLKENYGRMLRGQLQNSDNKDKSVGSLPQSRVALQVFQ